MYIILQAECDGEKQRKLVSEDTFKMEKSNPSAFFVRPKNAEVIGKVDMVMVAGDDIDLDYIYNADLD